jgi:hypothetical protein
VFSLRPFFVGRETEPNRQANRCIAIEITKEISALLPQLLPTPLTFSFCSLFDTDVAVDSYGVTPVTARPPQPSMLRQQIDSHALIAGYEANIFEEFMT